MMLRVAATLVLLQLTTAASDAPMADPQHFRYDRAVHVPPGSAGQTCAVLEETVLAHSAKQSLDDLRLYSGDGSVVPFTVTESGSSRMADEQATLRNAGTRGGDIVFELGMPNRPYTSVELNLDAKDFLANAKVSGSNPGQQPVQLGDFALFDLTSQHLSRSTTLPLQESTFRDLHVSLHVVPSPGAENKTFAADMVRGATIPPSREAQTLYTTVATASPFVRRGRESVATVHVGAHVPVERFAFDLDPSFTHDFLRNVNITARPDNAQDTASVEALGGEISHTTLPSGATGFVADDSLSRLNIDAVLGADLRDGATVEITVQNGDDAPLPIRAVHLQMRQRRICFDATGASSSYTLRYGDDGLPHPVYDYARLFVASRTPVSAQLGPEEKNATFRPRSDTRPYSERHPELLWVALVAVVAALGTVALRSAKKRH